MATNNPQGDGFNLSVTDSVINATGPKADSRLREVIANLTRHLHDFCRESRVTRLEFEAALKMLIQAGQMTDDKRDEMLLLTDVLASEALIDDITHVLANDNATVPTALGPFWRSNAPRRQMGDTIVFGIDSDQRTHMHGCVMDSQTGEPIRNAVIDVWETAPNGKYEQQDENQIDMNLRGLFTTRADGEYNFYCLRPTTYAIPSDGPAGELLQLLDRHPMRPAHIHFIVSAPGYNSIVTELFDGEDKHIYDDAVFAVRESLVIDFKALEGDPKADFVAEYDFRLSCRNNSKM